jgi:peptidoglycan/LPS O-acetylase OafA/YrhL
MMSAGNSPHRFRTLDGWRGICALLVALFHFGAPGHFYFLPLVRNAWLFVDFFFVLSGFVIAYAYGGKLREAASIKDFALRRFARLWPLHVAVLMGFVILECIRFSMTGAGFTGERSLFAIVTNLALVQSLGVHDGLTWNTPSWSISTEFYTYLVFAGTCAVSGNRAVRVLISIVLMLGSAGVLIFFSRYGMRETFGWGFFRCICGFFAGVLTYELWTRSERMIPDGSAMEILSVALVLAFLIFVPGNHALEYLAVPVFACAVFVFARQRGVLSRMMEMRVVNALGRWSYSIYMVHMLVLALLFSALDSIGPVFHQSWTARAADGSEIILPGGPFAADAFALFYLAAVIALSALTFRFIEKPGQRLFTK